VTRLPAFFLLLAALLPWPAMAGSLYRCVGKQGEVAFTSSRDGYSQCSVLRTPAPAAAPAQAAAPATLPTNGTDGARIEFRTGSGSAAPVAAPGSEQAKVNRGAVHRYVRNGVTHYTNRPPAGQRTEIVFSYIESCFACSARPAVDFHNVALNTSAYVDEVVAAAAANGIDAAFVRAVIHAESAFNPNALSNKGAQGLMQLMPATAERFGVTDAFEAGQNIAGGTRYLAWLLKRFNGDTRLAAAGYNAGEGAVDRYGGVPPFQETQRFVERVGILQGRYRDAFPTAPGRMVGASGVAAP
jgi:soluble lytic murein transglycosylase-like protein